MPITLEELRELLSSDEPDYTAIGQMLDASAAPHLQTLARDPNVMLATKAVYAASLLPTPQSEAVVEQAAQSPEPLLRIASASAIANLPEESRNRLAERLISDDDISVKKLAIKAVSGPVTPQLRQQLDQLASSGETALLRQLANDKLSQP
jgi:HEAT repeat protein